MLVATAIHKAYGTTLVVEDVSLEVRPGEVLGLIGPNGGGKSTVLLMLAGLVKPTQGTVTFAGVAAHELALNASGTVGLITAEPGLYPAMTVRENLTWFLGLYGKTPTRLEALAEELGLTAQLDRRAAELSSGQRQKASLIRALLLEPAVLLFDEPTANLDPVAASVLHGQLRAKADDGLAVVLCTHDLSAAESVCDRVVVLNRKLRGERTFSGPRAAPTPGALFQMFEDAL